MRHPRTAVAFHWDDTNEDHLARHRVRADEIERIFANDPVFMRNKRGRAGVWLMLGTDPDSGRVLKTAVSWQDEDAGVLRAVTAFDV